MRRARAQEPARVRIASQSAQMERSQDSTLTRTVAGHGFLRDKNGVITTYDVPGAGTGPRQGTFGGGFTPNGSIMGDLVDADDVSHGFIMDKDGTFTTFDAPDAGTGFARHVPFWNQCGWSDLGMVR